MDSAFWLTFAGFGLPTGKDPRRDLDLASYGVAAILDDNGTDWRPEESFHAPRRRLRRRRVNDPANRTER